MSMLNCAVDTSGSVVVKVDELVAYLDSLIYIAYWRSGEQILDQIRKDVEASRLAINTTIAVS